MAFEQAKRSFFGPVPVANVAALKALPSVALAPLDLCLVVQDGVIVRWAPSAEGQENLSYGIILPDDLEPGQPGRWIYDATIPFAVSPSIVKQILRDYSGAPWPTAETVIDSSTLEVPIALTSGTAAISLYVEGAFTATGTRQAMALLRHQGGANIVSGTLESAASNQTTSLLRRVQVPLSPGSFTLEVAVRAGAGFGGLVSLSIELYSVLL